MRNRLKNWVIFALVIALILRADPALADGVGKIVAIVQQLLGATINVSNPTSGQVLQFNSSGQLVNAANISADTLAQVLSNGNSADRQINWSAGAGVIVHLQGPTDQQFLISSAASRSLAFNAGSGGDIGFQLNGVAKASIANSTNSLNLTALDLALGNDKGITFRGATPVGDSIVWAGATTTTSKPMLQMAQTWNGAGIFDAATVNVTITSQGAGSRLLNLQTGGTPAWLVKSDGSQVVAATATLGWASSTGMAVANPLSVIALSQLQGTPASLNVTNGGTTVYQNLGPFGIGSVSGVPFGWVASATDATGALDTALTRESPGIVDFGTGAQGSKAGSIKATNGTFLGVVNLADGTAGAPSITFTALTTLGFYRTGTNLTAVGGPLSCPGAGATSERFGNGSLAGGLGSVAFGNGASAPGDSSLALGGLSVAGTAGVNANAIAVGKSASATGAGSIAIGLNASSTNSNSVAVGLNSSATGIDSMAIGPGASTGANSFSVALGFFSAVTAANQFVCGNGSLGNGAITNVYFGTGVTSTTPLAYTINGTGGSGTNIAGAAIQLAAGQGTGTALDGGIVFQVAPIGATGTALNALVTVSTLAGVQKNLSGTNNLWVVNPTWADGAAASSGTNRTVYVNPTYNYTGVSSVSLAAFQVDTIETSLPASGSPIHYLIRSRAGALGTTDRFTVNNKGGVGINLGAGSIAAPNDATIQLYDNASTANPLLYILQDASSSVQSYQLNRASATAANGITWIFARYRGTIAVPTVTSSGDNLWTMTFRGTDTGGASRDSAQLLTDQDAASTATAVPGRFRIMTSSASASLAEAIRWSSDQSTRLPSGSSFGWSSAADNTAAADATFARAGVNSVTTPATMTGGAAAFTVQSASGQTALFQSQGAAAATFGTAGAASAIIKTNGATNWTWASGGAVTVATGLGAITHFTGPSDQNTLFVSGAAASGTAGRSWTTRAGVAAGADIAGGNFTDQAGLGTGAGQSGNWNVQTGFILGTGTTVQPAGDRLFVSGKVTSLSTTNTTTTTFVQLNVPTSNTSGGCIVFYTVEANDGTNWDTATGSFSVAASNKAGVVTATAAATNEASNPNSGTLSNASAVSVTGTAVNVRITPTWSVIVPTVVRISYTVVAFGNGVTVSPQ